MNSVEDVEVLWDPVALLTSEQKESDILVSDNSCLSQKDGAQVSVDGHIFLLCLAASHVW